MLTVETNSPNLQDIYKKPLLAKPFLKWAGGKQQLLTQFEKYFPKAFSHYYEPFIGGGAVFFHFWNTNKLRQRATLFDNNKDLINAYVVVRDHIDELIKLLSIHKSNHSRDYYYRIRSLDRLDIKLSAVEKAACTIYLNRTCYNGLYRVNQKGQFNVPMGSYKNPKILYEDTLRTANIALQGVQIETQDFRKIVDFADAGDFIYFDPPYDPVSKTSSFTGYTANNFQDRDQEDLADIFRQLSGKGCLCMLSNSHTSFIQKLYEDFRIETVYANRAINSNANGRGNVKEVIVFNY